MGINGTEELVNVPVPRKHLAAVYELIARLELGESALETAPGSTSTESEPEAEWPEELVRRAYAESSPAMKSVWEVLAARPDEVIDSRVLVHEALGNGAGWPNLAGTLGAFGNRVANRYGRETWPFEAKWSHELELMTYVMTSRVAEIVTAA